jgi:predicted TIM-barrel fold metal-dependent hydrolase
MPDLALDYRSHRFMKALLKEASMNASIAPDRTGETQLSAPQGEGVGYFLREPSIKFSMDVLGPDRVIYAMDYPYLLRPKS